VIGIWFLGAPWRSSRGPRRNFGESQRDRPMLASRVPPYRAPGSGGVSGAPATGVKGKETQAGGSRSEPAGRRADPDPHGGTRSGGRPRVRCGERVTLRRPAAGGLWAGAGHNPSCRRTFSTIAGCSMNALSRAQPSGDDPHGSRAPGTHERIHLVHLRDQASANPAERRAHARFAPEGDLSLDSTMAVVAPLRLPALPPTDGTVIGAS
jgi:hypothetical protein